MSKEVVRNVRYPFEYHVFQTLGMNDTYFYLPKEKHNRLAAIHQTKNGSILQWKSKIGDGVNPEYPTLEGTYFSGGAGLSSTIGRLRQFFQMFWMVVNTTERIS